MTSFFWEGLDLEIELFPLGFKVNNGAKARNVMHPNPLALSLIHISEPTRPY